MSEQARSTVAIGGKLVQGGFPAANQVIRFNAVTNRWEFVVAPTFDGAHTSLTDREVAGVIDHADLSVTTDKLALLAVTPAQLADDAVETDKILDLNVTTGKLDALAVTSAKIQTSAVTSVKLLNGAVIAEKIATDAVETAKIAGLAVTGAKLALLAVTNSKLAAFAVSLTKMKTELGNANLFIGYDGAGVVVAKAAAGLWTVLGDYEAAMAESSHTFSFAAIDFDDVSKLVLEIDLGSTAALNLEMRVNAIATGYFTDGTRVTAGAVTVIDLSNIAAFQLVSNTILDAANRQANGSVAIKLNKAGTSDRVTFISEFAGFDDKVERVGGPQVANVASLTDVVVRTSTSTWQTGTRMTLYKVARA